MALSWSFDKIGPICRTVGDAARVLEVISGHDPADPYSADRPFIFDPASPVEGVRIGYDPRWYETDPQSIGETALRGLTEAASSLGARLVETTLPDLPYESVMTCITVDSAAAFEALTLENTDDELVWQAPEAWPNTFRTNRFVPGVEYVQAQRFRTRLKSIMDELSTTVDLFAYPEHSGPLLLVGNAIGRPSMTLPVGFRENGTPFGMNLLGGEFEEALLCRVGEALEAVFAVAGSVPPGFE